MPWVDQAARSGIARISANRQTIPVEIDSVIQENPARSSFDINAGLRLLSVRGTGRNHIGN
jgi:hypothetical protein